MRKKSTKKSGLRIATALLLVAMGTAAESLPVTPAETLSGQKVQIPAVFGAKPAVCIFAFSKEAGERTKLWITRIYQDGMESWSVASLESAPGLVRGMIRANMRKGTPEQVQGRSLVITKDEKAWKKAVGAKQDALPVVVVLDGKGGIAWSYEGAFEDEPYRALRGKLREAGGN